MRGHADRHRDWADKSSLRDSEKTVFVQALTIEKWIKNMYTKYYGLTKKPFENTPDPNFLFLSKNHREVLASLTYAINSAKGFVLVVGDIGTGKTTLVHALIKQLVPSFIVLNIINPRTTFNDILDYLAKNVGISLNTTSITETVDVLRNKLEALHKQDRHVVLIVDEAHLLSDEALEDIRLVSNIESEERKLIQIVLVGQNELNDKLQRDSLKPLQQRLVITRRLVPLNREETEEYILHRLRIAGRQSQLFEKKALSLIWKNSCGIPRLINQICDNAMLIGYAIEARSIDSKIIMEVIGDMQSVHRFQTHDLRLLFHRFKWIGAAVVAVPLVVYLTAGIIPDKHSPSKNRAVEKGSVAVQSKKRIQPKIALTSQSMDSSDTGFSLVETGISSKQMETNPLFNETEELSVDEPQSSEKKQITGKDECSGPEKQESKNRESSTNEDSQAGAGENMLIKLSQKPVDFDREVLSKKSHEISAVGKSYDTNYRKVRPNECLYDLAQKEYGIGNESIIDLIQMANPGIRNVNRIYPGQEIAMPRIRRKNLIVKDEKGIYHIHYASFYRFKNAQQSVQDLIKDKDNQEAFVVPVRQGDNLAYRVYLGIFKDSDDAQKTLNTLKLKYFYFLDQ